MQTAYSMRILVGVSSVTVNLRHSTCTEWLVDQSSLLETLSTQATVVHTFWSSRFLNIARGSLVVLCCGSCSCWRYEGALESFWFRQMCEELARCVRRAKSLGDTSVPSLNFKTPNCKRHNILSTASRSHSHQFLPIGSRRSGFIIATGY